MSTATYYLKKKKKVILNTIPVKLGCTSCIKLNLSKIINPKPKPKPKSQYKPNKKTITSSSSCFNTTTFDNHLYYNYSSPSVNHNMESQSKCSPGIGGLGRVGGESMAIEKESEDPYFDFRHSMLQMILENQIYSKHDLRQLLNCFLQLNSPYHHGIIIRAFSDIWDGIFSLNNTRKL